MRKKVLVTGGAGFIGSHLADRILDLGHDVIIIDNESTGSKKNVPGAATFVRGDVRNRDDLEEVFGRGLDTVFHIAGQASTIRSFDDPLEDLNVNVTGTVNVVQKCLEHGVPRILFASSMTAYGHPEQLPIGEETKCKPISYYGITKYAAERYVQATWSRTDLDTPLQATSFRMFNVYGARQRLDNPYQGVMGIFIGNALRKEPIIIHGDGKQSRDFVHISDVVNAWIQAWNNPDAVGKVYNLGTGKSHSINSLVRAVLSSFSLTLTNYPVQHQPLRPGDQRHMVADIDLAQRELDWVPEMSFQAGVKQTVSWAAAAHQAGS